MEEGANKKTYEKLHKEIRFMDLIACIKRVILASNLNKKHNQKYNNLQAKYRSC
jgi:hypothetical protein